MSIEVNEYDDGRPCVVVDGLVLTQTLDDVGISADERVQLGGNKRFTLLDLPMLDSLNEQFRTECATIENVVYKRTGKLVEVDDCGVCNMEIVEVLVDTGEYSFQDGALTKID